MFTGKESNQLSKEQQNWTLVHGMCPPGLLGCQGRQALSEQVFGLHGNHNFANQGWHRLEMLFHLAGALGFCRSPSGRVARGCCLGHAPCAVMEQDEGWLQPGHPDEK